MKNNSAYIAVAALIAIVGAVVYGVLFSVEIIPSAMPFAVSGVFIAVIVLVLMTVAAIKQKTKNSCAGYSSFAALGRWLIFSAVLSLCASMLFLSITDTVMVLYIALLVIMIFLWKFTLLLWGFVLFGAVNPNQCSDNGTEVSVTHTEQANSCDGRGRCRY